MNVDQIFPFLFFGIAAYVLFILFTKRGKEFLFGGKIERTLSNDISIRRFGMNTSIQVHVVRSSRDGSGKVGLELSSRGFLSASSTPIVLTDSDALLLADMLTEAAKSTRGNHGALR